jgi:acyl transferase domain-containing protein
MSDSQSVLQTLGQLWQAGVPVQWDRLHRQEQRRRVSLPTYPFQRQRFWIEPGADLSQSAPPRQRQVDESPISNLDKRIAALKPEQRILLTEVLRSRGLEIPASAQGLTTSEPDPERGNYGP